MAKQQGPLLQLFALVVFVVVSANDTVVKSWSKRRSGGPGEPKDFPYSISSVLLVASMVSVASGCLLALLREGVPGLMRCWDAASLLRMAPVSLLFQLATLLKFVALRHLPPETVALLSQMNLILLALAMRLTFGKRYQASQWVALGATCVAMLLYLSLRGQDGHHHEDERGTPAGPALQGLKGLPALLLMCVLETLASVLAERYLKGVSRGTRPEAFYVQKVHIDFAGLVCTAVWCSVVEAPLSESLNSERSLFSGWDLATFCVLLVVILKLWLGSLVAKVLDSVVKQLGSCAALVLTYLEVLWLRSRHAEGRCGLDTTLALAMVVLSIASFAACSHDAKLIERLQERTAAPSAESGRHSWVASYNVT